MEHNVKNFLAYAAKCKTEADAIPLLTALQEALFLDAPDLAWLERQNDDFSIENGKPYVHFELNRVISDHYITTIRPEIRDGKMRVNVATNRMLDGHGLMSQRWEVAHELDEDILPSSDMTMQAVALRAKRIAIDQHVTLLEMLGIPRADAQELCKKLWKAPA
jgi:hypothetical protein